MLDDDEDREEPEYLYGWDATGRECSTLLCSAGWAWARVLPSILDEDEDQQCYFLFS